MRRGVTIVEVLFSILVVSIGLLGSIAVFVVASTQMKKAIVNDSVGVIGRSAVHKFDTLAMRRPEKWHTWNGNYFVPIFDPSKREFTNNSFSLVQSYCIDSRFATANTGNWNAASTFPCNTPANQAGPRMHRVAFLTLPPLVPPNQAEADKLLARHRLFANTAFWCEDDLTVMRSDKDRSLPAEQVFAKDASNVPVKRQSDGHFSWMATLSPTPQAGTLANGNLGWIGGDSFVLSVVVFHDRESDLNLEAERTLGATVLDDGSTGGEVQLTSADPARLKIKAGQWILLSGMRPLRGPNGNTVDTYAYFRWYRVTTAEREPEVVAGGHQIHATLIGQDWASDLTNQQAVVVDGVVGVYEKTIRLDYGSTF
jgi:hypothetical protein